MVRRIIRIFVWFLAVVVVLAAGLAAYLRSADLSVYQGQVETFVSNKLGHEFQVRGRFELQVGRTTTLVAESIALHNQDWPGETRLIRAGHLTFAFNTWSVFSGPFLVENLTAREIEVIVSYDEAGQANWETELPSAPRSDPAPLDLHRIAFRSVNIDGVTISYTSPRRAGPVVASIERLTISPDPNDILDLDLRGDVNGLPLWADGKLGPWQNFIDGRDIFADLDLSLADTQLSVEGRVADLLRLEGVEIDAVLSGPDISRALNRLSLPPFAEGAFEITGNVQRMDQGHQVRIDGNLGAIEMVASGTVDSLLLPQTAAYDFNVIGPNARHLAELFGFDQVAAVPFQLSGDYARNGYNLEFKDSLLQVGENSIAFDGRVDIDAFDLDLTILAEGPDISVIGPFVDVEGIPVEPFRVSGHVLKDGATWEADLVDVRIGENLLKINGRVETGSSSPAQIALEATGPDISVIQEFTDLEGIPARPYDIDIVIRPHPEGIVIEEGTGIFGDNRLQAQGILALRPKLAGSRGTIGASGPEFHNVALLSGIPYLPSGPFDIEGSFEVTEDSLRLSQVIASVDSLTGTASGQVGIGRDNGGDFELEITLSGADVSAIPGVDYLREFAGDSFDIDGSLRLDDDRLTATGLRVRLGNLNAEIDGTVIGAAERVDFAISADAEDSLMLGRLARLEALPEGIVHLEGGVTIADEELAFTAAKLSIGDYHATADGRLHLRPRSNDSDLDFSIVGPSLLEAGQIYGVAALPDKPFSLSGQFEGTPTGFEMENFVASVGDNDLQGRLDANLEEKPTLVGEFTSNFIDLTTDIPALPPDSQPAPQEAAGKPEQDEGRLFSGEPLDTSWLQKADIDVNFQIAHLKANTLDVSDIDVAIELRDGALRIDPFYMRENTGSIEASFSLVPGEGAYSMSAGIIVDDVHIGLMASDDQPTSELPALTGRAELKGQGASIRSIMGSSNGSLSFRQGRGRVKEVFGSAIFKDVLLQALRALNPRRERGMQTIECGIYDATVNDGVLTIDRLALQTDAMTVVASGTVRLQSERLNITFRAKPREGLGVSFGTVVNSFLALGGTLSNPSITLDPSRSVTTTGAAVATGGLSLLARGLWDRLSAEADICKKKGD